METSLSAKIIRNVVSSGLRVVLLAPIPFVMTPFFLKKIGTGGYGTWAVFLAINGMVSLADFGLVTSVSKHVAQYYAHKDFRALGELISTGLLLYGLIACVVTGVLWAGTQIFVRNLFHGSPIAPAELSVLWRFLVLLVFANILTMFWSSIVVGLQRMDLSNVFNALNMVVSAGLSAVFLFRGLGLRGILYGYALAAFLVTLIYGVTVRALLPEVKLKLSSCRLRVAREIVSFSAKAYVTQICVAIHNQMEKFYLARFVGVVPVGWYDVSSDLALKLRGIPSLVLVPVMPAASELDAMEDHARLTKLYSRAHKYLALVGVPLVVYAVLISKRFVNLWIGPSFELVAVPFCALLIMNFVNIMTGPGFLILMGRGRLLPGLYGSVLGIAVNVVLSFFLIRAYGFAGAVIGTSVALGVGSLFFFLAFQRETGISLLAVMRSAYAKPLVSALAVAGALWASSRLVYETGWLLLVAGAVAFGIGYLAGLLLLRFFDTFDIRIIERFLPVPEAARKFISDAQLASTLETTSGVIRWSHGTGRE